MICPFCREAQIGDISGSSTCPVCKTGYDIDDRGECIFVDAERPRIPVDGLVCMECGLVQEGKWDSCVYCGTIFNMTVH
jgi:uncharacterized Zn-finger protein